MKRILLLLIIVCFCAVFPLSDADADGFRGTEESTFILPSSLEKIEDEAFENTAVKTIIFQNGLCSIGDYAFIGARNLTDVYVPATAKYIGKNSFPSNERLTLHGVMGSYAAKWAKEHEVPFMTSDIWILLNDSEIGSNTCRILIASYFYHAVNLEKSENMHGKDIDEGKSMRPQERPELNPIDYRFP